MDRRERSELLGERKKTSLNVAYPTRVSSRTSLHLFAVSRMAKIRDIHHRVGKWKKRLNLCIRLLLAMSLMVVANIYAR